MIDGPNGAGSIETVSVNMNGVSSAGSSFSDQPVTQGELIRQEQEAGIAPVPLARATRSSTHASQGGIDGEADKEDEDEQAHARGPNLIGMSDLGPQAVESGLAQGIEIEGGLEDKKREDDRANKASDDADDLILADADPADDGKGAVENVTGNNDDATG